MTGRVLPLSRRPRPRRIRVQQIGLPPVERWLVVCDCTAQVRLADREAARAWRRRHQAEHTRVEAAHPARGARSPEDGGSR
ncbi:hypothetical protein ACXET9_07100 [Brachybacterium sp. DNPG3]